MESSTGSGPVINPNDPVSEVSKARIAGLYPGLRPLVFRVLQDIALRAKRRMNVAQGIRTFDEQLQAYSKGRTLVGAQWTITAPGQVVTNAKPGLSWHCYGLGWDASWAGQDPYLDNEDEGIRDSLWKAYGDVGVSYGFKWGGDFHLVNGVADRPHLELTYGLTIDQAVELYEKGGLAAVWASCDGFRGVDLGKDWNLPGVDPLA